MARRIPGVFVPVDVNLSSDQRIIRVGAMGELLYRRGLEHVKKTGRDGVIFHAELPEFARGIATPAKQAAALVHEGLWVERDGESWQVRSWLKWNASNAERAEQKEKNRLGALKTNHAQGRHETPYPDCPECQK